MGRLGSGIEVRENSIRLDFSFDGVRHKPTLKGDNGKPLGPTVPNIRHAIKLVHEIKQKIRLDVFSMSDYFSADGKPGTMTVGRQLDVWFDTLRLEASTLAGYKSAVNFWKNAQYDKERPAAKLGDRSLRAFGLADAKTALALRPELSGKTINNYVTVLNEALALALADKSIERNVALEIPRAKWQRDPPDPFSREETEAIIESLCTHAPEQACNLVEWWFFTGVRTSEAFGLKWNNVDLTSNYVKISEALVRGEQKSSTKTSVVRNVLLNSRAADAMKRQKEHTFLASEYVWLDDRYNMPWADERAFRRSYWEPTLKRLGIRYRRPYNMRHSYATMMLMSGAKPAWCAGQLGHSVEVFLGTYSKWIEGKQDAREIAGLEAWLIADDVEDLG